MWNVDANELVTHLVPTLCVWREASGEGPAGMYAVACVIRNRAAARKLTPTQVCLQPWQFSSMAAPRDPGMMHFPAPTDASFQVAFQAWRDAEAAVKPDPTGGATDYYATTIAEPAWARSCRFLVQIGRQRFYKEIV